MWLQIWFGIPGTFSTKGTYWNIINNKQCDGSCTKGNRQSTERQGFKTLLQSCSKTTLVQVPHCRACTYKSWNTIAWSVHAAMTNSSSENNIASLPSSPVFNSAQTLSNKSLLSNCLETGVSHYHQTSNLRFQRGFLGMFVCLFKVELSEPSYTH